MKPKTIIITGASRGIGKELVYQLAEYSGHQVLALSRNVSKMESDFYDFENVSCHEFDLSRNDVKEQTAKIIAGLDSIDVLINNAGYLVNKPFPELTHEDFLTSYQINVIGVMETVQAVLPKMKEGHIVNISSVGGYQGSVKFPGLTAYSTSKAALCSFTELFAEEHKETTIAMNCLCLGAAQTEMLEEAFPGYQAPVSASEMAEYIGNFALNAQKWMRGKIIPVSSSTP